MSKSTQHRSDFGEISRSFSLLFERKSCLLSGVESVSLRLSLGFESLNKRTVVPAEFLGKLTEDSEVAVSSQVDHFDGIRDDHALLGVVWLWDTFVGLRERNEIQDREETGEDLRLKQPTLIAHEQSCVATCRGSDAMLGIFVKESERGGRLTVLHSILEGDLKCRGPFLGLVLVLLSKN